MGTLCGAGSRVHLRPYTAEAYDERVTHTAELRHTWKGVTRTRGPVSCDWRVAGRLPRPLLSTLRKERACETRLYM